VETLLAGLEVVENMVEEVMTPSTDRIKWIGASR
jgi:hypothetical protein